MWRRRQAVLVCLSAAVAACLSAAVPTTENLVVTRSEDESTTTPEPYTDPATEEPHAPLKLTEMDVKSKVSLRYAHTSVTTRVRNSARRAQETTFRMLLPDTAFISGFTMTIDGKSYKAYVKEKEEAKQIYQQAVSQGFGAAHVTAKARDSNHFTVSVNVEPNTTVQFHLTYEELLVRRNGVYNHAINLHPGALVPKMKVTVHIKEAEKITVLRVPEVRTGNEIDATADDPQNSNAVIKRTHDDREAIVTFTPDIHEQRRLIQVYAEKTKESFNSHYNYYPEDDDDMEDKAGVLGQFVVQYDVDRSKTGEILVNDGYFVHFFAPPSLPPLPKHVVFVLDTSGSMMGRKIEQLRSAMQTILSDLHPSDYFSVVEFNSNVKVHDLKEADGMEPPPRRYYYFEVSPDAPTLVPPSQATTENIAKAKVIVSRLEAAGGTNIADALDVAVDLIKKGTVWNTTDTQQESNDTQSDNSSKNNTTETEEDAILEPIVIFLTDGDPTIGETDPIRIINRLTEKNFGVHKASIFSLAFGQDADRKFMRKLSLRNEGFLRHIYEAADAAQQLRHFYRQVSSPLLANVKFIYSNTQIKEGSLTKHKFRTYYAGSETVVAGRVEEGATELQPQVEAFCGVEDGTGRKRYEISPKVPVVRNREEYFPLERVWAYLTIKQLLDAKDAELEHEKDDDEDDYDDSPKKKALALALKYEFVTPLTSLVVVKPNDTRAVDAESVDDNHVETLRFGSALASSFAGPRPVGGSYASVGLSRPLSYLSLPKSSIIADPSISALRSSHHQYHSYPASAGLSGTSNMFSHFMPNVESAQDFAVEDEDDALQGSAAASKDHSGILHSYTIKTGLFRESWVQTPVFDSSAPSTTEDYHPSTTYNPLKDYSLENYSWTLPLLDVPTDSLELMVNDTQVVLKLKKDGLPLSSTNATECDHATDGTPGQCVYLTRCPAARDITPQQYSTTYCIVDNGYAGVCCPKSKVDATSP